MTLKAPPTSLLDKYAGTEILPLYTARVTVGGGEARHGRASGRAVSDDGQLDISLRLPKELGGPGGGTNPEQLFAAGYAACFHGALNLVAAKTKVAIPDVKIAAIVTFGRDPSDGLFLITADIEVSLPGMAETQAQALIDETEKICPYAKILRQGATGAIRIV